jgi:hypothetical protein
MLLVVLTWTLVSMCHAISIKFYVLKGEKGKGVELTKLSSKESEGNNACCPLR